MTLPRHCCASRGGQRCLARRALPSGGAWRERGSSARSRSGPTCRRRRARAGTGGRAPRRHLGLLWIVRDMLVSKRKDRIVQQLERREQRLCVSLLRNVGDVILVLPHERERAFFHRDC
eukprot:800210-Rhodomonas_salina.2